MRAIEERHSGVRLHLLAIYCSAYYNSILKNNPKLYYLDAASAIGLIAIKGINQVR
jgi:hypothetical protein